MILQKLTSSKTNKHYQLKQQVRPSLISGLELRSDAWVIAWNSEDYLKVLQTHITQLLTEHRETLISKAAQLNSRLHSNEVVA